VDRGFRLPVPCAEKNGRRQNKTEIEKFRRAIMQNLRKNYVFGGVACFEDDCVCPKKKNL
jgi:hypothetical protein